MNSLPRLSQGHLNLLATCPPQFQRVYLEKLAAPPTPEQEEKRQWGTSFHLLMQQLELGLPIGELLREHIELKNSLQALLDATSEIWSSPAVIAREAEQYRTLNYRGYLLTVIYDLLITYERRAVIFDWKTYLQPEKPDKLAKNWQTRLYLYVLAETSEYRPEELAFTYWFVKLPTKPQQITFQYDRNLHERTGEDLKQIIDNLTQWSERYELERVNFPHRRDCEHNCPYYSYFCPERSKGQDREQIKLEELICLDNIQEVPLL